MFRDHIFFPWQAPYGVFYTIAAKDWRMAGAKQMFVNPEGCAKVEITGTGHTPASLYAHPSLQDTYIKRILPATIKDAKITDGDYHFHCVFVVGDAVPTETNITFTNGTYYWWGGIYVFAAGDVTVNFGTKTSGARQAGCNIFQIGWKSRQQQLGDATVLNMFDTTWNDTSASIDPASLTTTEGTTTNLEFGDDTNFNWSGQTTMEAVRLRNMYKFRKQTDSASTLTTDEVTAHGVDNLEAFYNTGDFLLGFNKWLLEAPDIGMPTTGNAQIAPFAKGIYYRKCRIVAPVSADASVGHAYNVFWIGNAVGTDPFDLNCKLARDRWQAGAVGTIFQCVPISIRVIDATGAAVSGAVVNIYSNLSQSTLALFVDTTTGVLTRSNYSLTTNSNGDVVNGTNTQVDLLYQQYNPAGALTGTVTALMSAHVAAGALTNTVFSPYRLTVTKTGFKTFVGVYEFKQTEIVMEVGLDVPQANTGPIFITGILP